jgi:hypothetical protein
MTKAKTRNNRITKPSKRINIWLSLETYDAIKKEAADRFLSISALVEEKISEK